jgi:hypothetical protein
MSGSSAGAPRSGLCYAAQRRGAKAIENKCCHRDRDSQVLMTRTSCISSAAWILAQWHFIASASSRRGPTSTAS